MSRYYDSNTGRFINADAYISTGQGILGYNMYAYCGNNPIVRTDKCGAVWEYEAFDQESRDMLEDQYFGIESSYYNYQIYSQTAAYDAYLGGYYYCGGGSIGGYTSSFAIGGYVSVDDTQVKTNGHSTGRTQPEDLLDQLAMEQAVSAPYEGKIIDSIKLRDPRWPASQGWVKMQQVIYTSKGNIEIHYVYNARMKTFDDF